MVGLALRMKLCAAASSAWLLLGETHARAAPELLVDLRYEVQPALAGCPSQTEFQAIVARQLGYDPHRAGSSLGVVVRAWRAEHQIEGVIEWSAAPKRRVEERRFVSRKRDCGEMMATMGFVMAVQIQVMAREPRASATQESGGSTPPARAESTHHQDAADSNRAKQASTNAAGSPVKSEAALAPPAPASPSSPWSTTVGLGPSVGLGLGPGPIVQGRLFFAVQLGRAALELGVEASLPSTTRQDYGGGFRHGLLLGTVAACGQQGSVLVCGLAKLGRIDVTGVGVDRPASQDGLLAQVGLRLAYSVELSHRVFFLGHLDALFPIASWTVDLNHEAAWTMPRIAAVAGINVAARFR